MTLTVQQLVIKLDEFDDSATIQVEDEGIKFHITDITKDEAGNVLLAIKSEDEDDDDDEELE